MAKCKALTGLAVKGLKSKVKVNNAHFNSTRRITLVYYHVKLHQSLTSTFQVMGKFLSMLKTNVVKFINF